MFHQLNDSVKQWVVRMLMGSAALLLAIGFLSGLNERTEDPAQAVLKEAEHKREESVAETEKPKGPADEYGDMGEVAPTPVENEEMPPSMEELFTEEEIEESKETAENFIAAFHPFDGDQPAAHVKRSKPFLTSGLYTVLRERIERPTAMTMKREVINIVMIEPFAPSAETMTWMASVEGVAINSQLRKRNETDLYTVKLKKENGTFKVSDFLINYLE